MDIADLIGEKLAGKARLIGVIPLSMNEQALQRLEEAGVDPKTAVRTYSPEINDAQQADCDRAIEAMEQLERMRSLGVAPNSPKYAKIQAQLKLDISRIRIGTTEKTGAFPLVRYAAPD